MISFKVLKIVVFIFGTSGAPGSFLTSLKQGRISIPGGIQKHVLPTFTAAQALHVSRCSAEHLPNNLIAALIQPSLLVTKLVNGLYSSIKAKCRISTALSSPIPETDTPFKLPPKSRK